MQNAAELEHASITCPVTDPGWRAQLKFTEQELKYIDPVPLLLGMAQQFHCAPPPNGFFVIVSELFNNALDHGLLKLQSNLKGLPDGMERYLALRRSRLAVLDNASIEICLEIVPNNSLPMLNIKIVDSGDGFDYVNFLAVEPNADIVPYGRGIQLVKRLCTMLEYSGCGNEVNALYRLPTLEISLHSELSE